MLHKRTQLLALVLGFITSFAYFRFFGQESPPAWIATKVFTAGATSDGLLPWLKTPDDRASRESDFVDEKFNASEIVAAVQQYKWRSDLESIFLLVVVKSAPGNKERRAAVRDAWFILNSEKKRAVPNRLVRQYFVIGQTKNETIEKMLRAEQEAHNDLLRAPLPDGYVHLTIKAMWSLSFAVSHHDFHFLLMADDDTFVNWQTFLPWIASSPQEKIYTGRLHSNALVQRDPKSKWYVPRDVYPTDHYPPFALGLGYVMTFDVVQKVVEIARRRPLLGIDDAMVGCLVQEAGIVPRHEEKVKVKWDCHDPAPYIIGGLKPDEMRNFGNRARQRQHLC